MPHLKFRRVENCAFCDQRAKSREDIWQRWLLRRFTTSTFGITGEVGGKTPGFDPKQRSLKVRCVCGSCNNGWMSDQEEAVIPIAEPMMEGRAVTLDMAQQRTLAQWAMKVAMVFEFVTLEEDRDLFYTADERHALKKSGDIPAYTAMWLGRYDGHVTFHTFGNDVIASSDDLTLNTYLTTLGYRHLLIQIHTIRADKPERGTLPLVEGQPRVGIPSHPRFRDCIGRFWPSESHTTWPPKNRLTDVAGMTPDDFHERFKIEFVY